MPLHHRKDSSYGTAQQAVEYRVRFRKHCHMLVDMGYRCIKSEDHSASCEDWITQRIVEEIKAIQKSPECPRWAVRYHIHDQIKLSVPNRKPKSRPVIDIEIEYTKSNRPLYHFEAKRLRTDRNDSIREYLGKRGLGCFLDELYARTSDEGGMLGYVQSGSPFDWTQDLAAKLSDPLRNPYSLIENGGWSAYSVAASIGGIFRTQHSRPNLGPIMLFHRVLDLRVPSS